MKTLGGCRWVNNYVGIPYKWGGRGPDGLDCYGLLALVMKDRRGVIVPDWSLDEIDLRARGDAVMEVVTAGTWTDVPTEAAQDMDIIICLGTEIGYHVGIVVGGGVLHATEGIGVIYQTIPKFMEVYPRVKVGTWQP